MIVASLAAVAVTTGAIAIGDAARRALASPPDPARDATVAIVWGLAGMLSLSAVLGVLGLFRDEVLVAAAVGSGVVAQWASRSRPVPAHHHVEFHESRAVRVAEPRWVSRAAIGAVGVVALLWLVASVETVRFGMADVDAQHYHLPHAFRFVQTGRLFDIHHVSAGDLAAYHPNNDEVLRAVGMATGRSVLPGLVVNWIAASLVLLASMLAGRKVGRPAAYVLLAASVLSAPLVGPVYGGRAFNDHLALGLLAAAAAIGMSARRAGMLATAGAALGLAVGTKLTVLAPAAVLAMALIATRPPASRVRQSAAVGVPVVVLGGWWYLRNLLATGNPAPGVDVPGLPQPSTPFIDEIGASVLSYATDLAVWEDWFVPGFHDALGWLWPVHLLVVAAGVGLGGLALVRRSDPGWPWRSALAGMALVTLVAWLTISTGAAGGPREPALFRFNVRYLFPAVLFGGWVVLERLPARWAGAIGVALVTATAVPALRRAPLPRIDTPSILMATAGVLAACAVSVAAWEGLGRRRPPQVLVRVATVTLVLAVAALAGPLRDPHLASRYTRGPSRTVLFSALEDTRGLHVGIVGLPLHYGFVGRQHANRVDYLGKPTGDGGFVNIGDCTTLMDLVREGGYDMVATLHFSATPPPPAASWLEASPSFQVEASAGEGRLWRVVAPPTARSCPWAGSSGRDD